MSDPVLDDLLYDTTIEDDASFINAGEQNTTVWRFRCGIRLLRHDKKYKEGYVENLAKLTHLGVSTLYERRDVAAFLWKYFGYSARRTFWEDHPELGYTHIRKALRYFADEEDVLDALMDVGDPDRIVERAMGIKACGNEALGDHIAEFEMQTPLTADAFEVYCRILAGKPVKGKPLFKQQGQGSHVFMNMRKLAGTWWLKEVEITVREVR